MKRLLIIIFFSFFISLEVDAQIWEKVSSEELLDNHLRNVKSHASSQRYMLLDFPEIPSEGNFIILPTPDGEMKTVRLQPSPILDPALQKRFPNIQSYTFRTENISGRMALDPTGIDVVYTTKNKRYALELKGNNLYELYGLTTPSEYSPDPITELGKCLTPMGTDLTTLKRNSDPGIRRAPTVNQKVYDLAISVTSTYAAQHGGTTESILAEVNKVFNRVNEVFLRELALRFQIIDESTKLFFLTTETDPYTEGNNTLLLNKLDELLVKEIGRINYDLGHLLATNCGPGTAGVSGGIGTICEFSKGKALSCDLTNNLEDYVRVLTHELGHQLGAAHSWSNCPGVNTTQRSSNTAYEPGSGSSIMSYINTCGNQNLKNIPGPFYFHSGSLQEMLYYTEVGPGSTCVATEEIANEIPEIVSMNISSSNALYIPIGTPFILSATARDNDGDDLTYAWDQLDTGPIAPLGEPIQSGPSIRSFAPDTSGTRYIPQLSSLSRNEESPEEVLPTYNRDFTFGLTVRDNHPNGGGLAQELVSFQSTTTAGPFFIDFPNDSTDQLYAGSLTKVQWNVAGTNTGLVNAAEVIIKMSTDGGKTFPIVLAERTDNDGEQDVQIPNLISDSVRFLIQGYDHIFFDVSDKNFPIVNPEFPTFGLNISPGRQIICLPQTAKVTVNAFPILGFDEPLTYSIDNPYPEIQVDLSKSQTTVNEDIELTFQVPQAFNSDTLLFKLKATGNMSDTITRDISLIVINNFHNELTLQYPTDDIQGVEVVPAFDWNPSPNADYYTLEVSTSASFNPEFLVLSEPNITSDSFPSTTVLDEGEVYFWRILPHNKCSTTTDVPIAGFQTKIQDCKTFSQDDLPKGLGASSPGEIISKIEVAEEFDVSDVNVRSLQGFHESVNQIKLLLEKDTTSVTLYEGECGIRSFDIDISFDDESVGKTDCRLSSGSLVKPLEPLSAFKDIKSNGTWNLRWQDSVIGSGGIFQNWVLELCGSVRVDRLEVKVDTLYVVAGGQNPLTKNQVEISNETMAIFEWIDSTRHGQLLKNGEPLQPGQKWTVDDISSGIIQYKNESNFDEEDITLSIESPDGRWSGIIKVPVKLDATVAVASNDLHGQMKVFPNPADSYINITVLADNQFQDISITGVQGNELYSYRSELPITQHTISTASWNPGMVYITIVSPNGDRWTKNVIIH